MGQAIAVGIDVVAIAILIAIYFSRHRRRDLALAYLCVNVGVLAVTLVLADSAVGAGLGLGLFGVLSIIRLRSQEIAQHEIAYYFAALAMGILAGFGSEDWLPPALSALLLVVMYIGDHPALMSGYRHQVVVLDRAIANDAEMRSYLTDLLGGVVYSVTVRRLDLVNDSTVVDVRYRVRADSPAPRSRDRSLHPSDISL